MTAVLRAPTPTQACTVGNNLEGYSVLHINTQEVWGQGRAGQENRHGSCLVADNLAVYHL